MKLTLTSHLQVLTIPCPCIIITIGLISPQRQRTVYCSVTQHAAREQHSALGKIYLYLLLEFIVCSICREQICGSEKICVSFLALHQFLVSIAGPFFSQASVND